jgi:uncharacterized protein YdhG (YjbR/CyaY superfamily)
MSSKATTVTEYLKTVPANHLDALLELRDLCMQTLVGFKEGVQYGMPSYSFHDQIKVTWDSQKGHISLCILTPGFLDPFRDQLKKHDVGKACIHYKKPADIDFSLIKKMLQEVAKSSSSS